MRRLFLIVAVVVLVTGAAPVSAEGGDFECDGLAATIIGTEGNDELDRDHLASLVSGKRRLAKIERQVTRTPPLIDAGSPGTSRRTCLG